MMIARNKKAKFNYQLLDRFEAGISLKGEEVKVIKAGGVNLTNSYVKLMHGEAYLVGTNLSLSPGSKLNPGRTRKLLLHKRELIEIETKSKAKKLTIVPIKLYTKGRKIKLELALAKSKRKFDKRQTLKKKDIKRDIERELKDR